MAHAKRKRESITLASENFYGLKKLSADLGQAGRPEKPHELADRAIRNLLATELKNLAA